MSMPQEVEDLESFLELLSWAVGVWADHDGEDGFGSVVVADTGRSKEVGAEPVDYGGLPSMVHAQWFLRMGAAGVTDWTLAKRAVDAAAYNKGSRVNRWVTGGTLTSLREFCKAAHIDPKVESYLRTRHGDFKREAGQFPVRFNAERVAKAIQATHAANCTTPGVVIAKSLRKILEQPFENDDRQHPDSQTASNSPGSAASQDRQATQSDEATSSYTNPGLVLKDRRIHPRLARGRLSLSHAGSPADSALVGTNGTVIAARDGQMLQIARVNRASGNASQWRTPLRLPDQGHGTVLAIDGSGPADVVFVWAGFAGTHIYHGTHVDGSVELIEKVDDDPATAAVMHGLRALLSFRDNQTARGTCDAFPELALTSMVGAISNGRLIVLAVGTADGQEGAGIEVDGRHRQRVPAGAKLELPLGARSFPIVRGADGSVIEVSPRPTSAQPYEHWVSPFLIGQAATA